MNVSLFHWSNKEPNCLISSSLNTLQSNSTPLKVDIKRPMIDSSVYISFVTNRSRPIVNASGHLTVSPTMINPEEKNCMVTNGNTTIPVSWWVFQPVQHRHSPSLWLRPQCCSVWPLLPEDGLPHFLRMHKHSLSRQEALIRNILSISSHGINTNRGLLFIWPIFQMSSRRAASVAGAVKQRAE